jgi:hypothetical protein
VLLLCGVLVLLVLLLLLVAQMADVLITVSSHLHI